MTYDVAILGAGQAAIPLAGALARAGKSVVLIESKHLGGSCVNFGCTPTKAAIASARVAHLARRGADYGLAIPKVEVDFPAVLRRARAIVDESRCALDAMFRDGNPRLIRAHARLQGRAGEAFRIAAGGETIEAREVVLDTGTRSRIPALEGLDGIDYMTSENWLGRERPPRHLLMIGGGYIGLEMGQLYRRLGAEVSIIEGAEQVAAHEDREVADALQHALAKEGVRFLMGAKVERLRKHGEGIVASVTGDDRTRDIEASDVFVATGRQPNTDDLGLETIGVGTDKHGYVEVDRTLRTHVKGVWAVGDIRGGPMFTHTSWDDYRIVASHMLGDGSRTLDRVVPYAVFTDPELGRVGMTEGEARKAGKRVRIGRFELSRNSKAIELGEPEGFIKVVVDAGDNRILGASVLCADGAELVHMYVDLMNARAPYTVIEEAIHIHPTLAEAVQSAVSGLGPESEGRPARAT